MVPSPATKRMSRKWQQPSSSRPKKAHSSFRDRTVMLMCYFEVGSSLLLEWLPTGSPVNAANEIRIRKTPKPLEDTCRTAHVNNSQDKWHWELKTSYQYNLQYGH
ncbi:hypothetical protein NPIL_701461 [Nephila pilipes]|uniref:Uncharacterized protein n=1 Tax=Nephila pilipes TaxID=299642 RepID=A0A8X6MS80_NEPPI|nr:hypothetical protein NPIL_701461 [Nephila pilipes]